MNGLEYLECEGNQISSLELSNVPNLETLRCAENNIASLDLSHVPNLKRLDCRSNPISSLDLSACPNIIGHNYSYNDPDLRCGGEPLKAIHFYKKPLLYVYEKPSDYVTFWGDRNADLYTYPEHINGMQYPKITWVHDE